MSLRDKFAMSPVLEKDGVAFELDTARITIARAGGTNIRYTAAMEKVAREHGRAIQNDLISNDKGRAILRDVYVDTIILRWETLVEPAAVGKEAVYKDGIEDWRNPASDAPDATLLPFTPENVKAILTELPDLLIEIRSIAENATIYRASHLEGVRKN